MLRPLPAQITIRGLTYRVEHLRMSDEAEVDDAAQVIRINRDLSLEAQWLAFIHELLEAITDPNNKLLPDHGKLSVLAEHIFTALKASGLLEGATRPEGEGAR